jgi:hypothetical protein
MAIDHELPGAHMLILSTELSGFDERQQAERLYRGTGRGNRAPRHVASLNC